MKISVIMLTYNREKLVSRMIECILSQTMQDFEFIIVDNGSTDSSGKIADEYAKKDNRIKVIHNKRGNIGSGRNIGLDMATGEYIAFVDDDDTCTADFLQFMYELAIDNNADVSICGATDKIFDEKLILTPKQAIELLLWRKRFNVQFPTKLIKKSLFKNNRFLESGKYDDIYLMPKILSEAQIIAYHGMSKYHFERHENNNSAWTKNHKLLDVETLEEYLQVYKERTMWLNSLYPDSVDTWKYFEWSFMISMVEKVTRLELTDCYDIRDKLLLELRKQKEKFINCKHIQEFEIEWMEKYINEERIICQNQ